MKMFVFTVLLLLLNVVEYSSCERFNIVPSSDSPCPGELTGEPCLTLQQYVTNPSQSSNIIFELQPGNHRLDSQLRLLNVNSFLMRGNSSVTVTCSQLYQPFYFSGLQQINISDIMFVGCRMELQSIRFAKFERNSFVDGFNNDLYVRYSSVLIRMCTISNNMAYSGAIYGYGSTFIIE